MLRNNIYREKYEGSSKWAWTQRWWEYKRFQHIIHTTDTGKSYEKIFNKKQGCKKTVKAPKDVYSNTDLFMVIIAYCQQTWVTQDGMRQGD